MRRRHRMGRRSSRKTFSKNAGMQKRNAVRQVMRGGVRC
jgi:hypothetical protein